MVDGPLLTPGQAFALDQGLVDLLRGKLPEVAEHTIAAVMDEVPSYAGAFGGPMGNTIEQAVQMALAGFLRLATRGRAAGPRHPALARARGRLRAGTRRGAQRPLGRRAALGVPRRSAGGLARARRDGGGQRRPGRHGGGVRGAGVRLHRRAVRGLGGGARRRAGDERAGPAAVPGPAHLGPAARRLGRRPGRGGLARRLASAQDADRRAAARVPGAPGPGAGRRPHAARKRGRQRPAGRPRPCCWSRTSADAHGAG